jgi:hypothetical protein
LLPAARVTAVSVVPLPAAQICQALLEPIINLNSKRTLHAATLVRMVRKNQRRKRFLTNLEDQPRVAYLEKLSKNLSAENLKRSHLRFSNS